MMIKRYCSMSMLGFAVCSEVGYAGGFRVPEMSVEGIALTDALVANPDQIGAFPYNYATMVLRTGKHISLDAIGVAMQADVAPSAPNTEVGVVGNDSDAEVIPSLYYSQRINDEVSWGAHVGVPYGIGSSWPDYTYSHFDTVDTASGAAGAISGLHPTSSTIEVVNLSPSVAFNIQPNIGIALAIDYYMAKKVELNAVGSSARGDGDGYGFAAAFLGQKDDWTFGLSYHSKADIDIDGHIDIAGVGRTAIATEVTLPSRLQIGVHKRINKVTLEFDIERIGWSSFDKLTLVSKGGAIPSGTVISETTENWRDITNYRAGVTYQYTDNMQLLFGGGFEDKVQSDAHFDATVPDNERFMLSIGLNYRLENDWTVSGGYQYAWGKKRQFSGRSYLDQVVDSGGANTDPNGSDVYNGDYRFSSHMLGVGFTKQF